MTKHLKTQFIIADGARARWVARSHDADDFVTMNELKGEPIPPTGQHGVVFESVAHRGFGVEEPDAAVREHGARFARQVAELINASDARGEVTRLVLVAPDHTLAEIKRHLSPTAEAKLAATLAKDLTKVPDHELKDWLLSLELG